LKLTAQELITDAGKAAQRTKIDAFPYQSHLLTSLPSRITPPTDCRK
jgi:hypothetical protein